MNRHLDIVILAAGVSKRMNSQKSKVLHKVAGRFLILYPLDVAKMLSPANIYMVIGGPHKEDVESALEGENIKFVYQGEPLGTGDAVMRLSAFFGSKKGELLVLPGDAPLVRYETIKELYRFHQQKKASVSILTAEHPEPTGYGRVVRKGDKVIKIIEELDASLGEKGIKEVNSGIYIFDTEILFRWLSELTPQNMQGEYYLTDVVEIIQGKEGRVYAFKTENWEEILGVNTRSELSLVESIMQRKLKRMWMERGVTFIQPETTYIEYNVKLGEDVTLFPNLSLMGETEIGKGSEISSSSVLINAKIPPFSYVKPGTIIENKEVTKKCQ